jgi:hypothetical protein
MIESEAEEFLQEYCLEHDVPYDIALFAYDLLGPNELYDGVIGMLEDYIQMGVGND